MSVRKSVSISPSPELHAVVERTGRYGNFSEVVWAALPLLDEPEQRFSEHGARPVAPVQGTVNG